MQVHYDVSQAAEKIRQWEADTGLRGQDIARRVGISHAHYSDIRRGKKRGSIETLSKLVDLFGKSLNDLIGEEIRGTRDRSKQAEMDEIRALLPIVDYWKENLSADELHQINRLFATTKGRRLFLRLARECIAADTAFLQGLDSLLDLSESKRKT